MRPLILSFFAVILVFSLFFDKKTEDETPASQRKNSVLMDNQIPATDSIDTILIFKDRTAFVVR